jgi:hypothetical protein
MMIKKTINIGTILLSTLTIPAQAGEWTTEVDLEMRHYLNKSATVQQYELETNPSQKQKIADTGLAHQDEPSIAIQPSYFNEWDGKKNTFSFKPFFRWDGMDDARTHADIREMVWKSRQGSEKNPWDLRVGIDKVFWGVAESHHLVDIINQTDEIEDPKLEQKLGQPMIRATTDTEWGVLNFFVLPYFRERTYSGAEGRLRTPTTLVRAPVVFEASTKQSHLDFAARWSKRFDKLDIGLSYFRGTSRDPRIVQLDSLKTTENPLGLQVNYDLISQAGLDVNYLLGDWILKLEAIERNSNIERYYAYVTGVEYTFTGIFNSQMDLTNYLEYNYDSRNNGDSAPVLENDVFVGCRLALNDENSTDVKVGIMTDVGNASRTTRVEINRRLNDKWSIRFLGQGYHRISDTDPLYSVKEDSFIQSTLIRYF